MVVVTISALVLTADRSAAQDGPSDIVETPPLGRLLDTRTGAALAASETITVGTGEVGALAVGVNITLDQAEGPGFVTVWANGPRPDTSAVNTDREGSTVATT